jgi:polysaccharide biosynthesis protein PslA
MYHGEIDANPEGVSRPGVKADSPTRRLGERGKALDWNSALDLWLFLEVVTLALAIAGSLLLFGRLAPPLGDMAVVALGWVAAFATLAWYRRSLHASRPRSDAIGVRIADWCKASAIALIFSFLAGAAGDLSRIWAISAFVAGAVTIALVGVLARAIMFSLTESGALGTRIAIYGCGEGTRELIDSIAADSGPAARIDGLYDERGGRGDEYLEGREVSRDVDELIARAKAHEIDAVMLNLPWSAYDRIDALVHRLEQVNVDILMAPSRMQIQAGRQSIGFVRSIPTLSLYRRPVTGLQALGKVLLDRGLAAAGLILLCPALLLVALLIKLDSPGPVLFRQKRRGMNNDPFDMLKFRSMYVHAEDQKAEKLVTRGDSRVTRIGAFIRRTSIDELPQLINVLKGDMSLVGPRPHVCEAKAADRLYEEVVRRYPARHRVLPGITGLAQVRGFRGNGWDEDEIVNRVKSDLEYIDRWSLGLDIAIILRTALTLVLHRNVY